MIVFRGSVLACSALRSIYPVSWPTPFKGQSRTASVCPGRVDCAESSLSQSWRKQYYKEKNKSEHFLLHWSSKFNRIVTDGVCNLPKISHWEHSPNPQINKISFVRATQSSHPYPRTVPLLPQTSSRIGKILPRWLSNGSNNGRVEKTWRKNFLSSSLATHPIKNNGHTKAGSRCVGVRL
jgi:hypothetical protein